MEVTIDGVKYRKVDSDSEYLAIVVLDRGFVVAGNVRHEGPWVFISDCVCIRRWGTTRGLGELATIGPTDKTVLDPQPETKVHQLQVVQFIRIEGVWPWKV